MTLRGLLPPTDTDCAGERVRTRAMPTLRQARAERLLSIRELAAAAGVAPSTIYLIEAGRTRPRPRVIRRLARALDVDPRSIDEFREAIEALAQRRRRPEREPPDDAEPLAGPFHHDDPTATNV